MNMLVGSAHICLRAMFLRLVLFALIWWVLTDGSLTSWALGAPVVLFATLISVLLMPSSSWSLRGVIRFIPYFLWHSMRGGVDVARRAMHPQMPVSPALIDYRFRLPPGLSRVFMADTVSLLPGTLSVELSDEMLRIHVLDDSRAIKYELNALENYLADIFRLELAAETGAVL